MFKIITQTDDFVVVAKSAGVNFHDEGQQGSGLFSQVKKQMEKQFAIADLYPIHRLDKMTSGLVLFAKNLKSAQIFGQLFEEHSVEKYYLAISDKKPTKKQGLIKGDMAKSRRGMFKLLRSMDNPAITQFFSYPIANKQRLYLLKPHSGKTHQLRVALSSIGAPILGDPLYNSNSVADRGYLHAYALRFSFLGIMYQFILPSDEGEYYLSQSIKDKLTELDQPWLLNWPK
ncbi:TIGR01621 family pseudouridine synthase [Candidatus Colwellia aromaticivorans]|uniref:TIGR01621 family pseudouridine synthase n=1 Tax=Candidatus Colwellia aromaticivorans TaxID=2267621 RepID=UPI000DF3DA4D|nr:TIGR01621 family pseudouridine synthase [Candidatus Colwellia aromaticivorans]